MLDGLRQPLQRIHAIQVLDRFGLFFVLGMEYMPKAAVNFSHQLLGSDDARICEVVEGQVYV